MKNGSQYVKVKLYIRHSGRFIKQISHDCRIIMPYLWYVPDTTPGRYNIQAKKMKMSLQDSTNVVLEVVYIPSKIFRIVLTSISVKQPQLVGDY